MYLMININSEAGRVRKQLANIQMRQVWCIELEANIRVDERESEIDN